MFMYTFHLEEPHLFWDPSWCALGNFVLEAGPDDRRGYYYWEESNMQLWKFKGGVATLHEFVSGEIWFNDGLFFDAFEKIEADHSTSDLACFAIRAVPYYSNSAIRIFMRRLSS
ncbi:uncharacterized protein EV420DRAFT_1481660 [Desarmillaria tabescens]|uniref:Uncharacterized protein n=1 Tax=Armillaria tabescens TaxID=1929756 RepID=A0AA39N1Y9_ARMTA|nr:uncharacterized protein EV420DRAFT_1481660 [Desarmillaria tabescens]KAK0454220.1 hypothetical protein EV420DRAFT_1481660 [Desarmillaria tabescens]